MIGLHYMAFCLWDRFDRGYQNDRDRSRSRSPERGASGWGDRSKGWNRDRSRSRSRSPQRQVRSFHQAMMEKGRPSQHTQLPNGSNNGREQKGYGDRESPSRDRASSPNRNGGHEDGFGRSYGGGHADGPRSSQYGEEAEEGMIPQDE